MIPASTMFDYIYIDNVFCRIIFLTVFQLKKKKTQHLNKFTLCFRKERSVLNYICSQEGYRLSGSGCAFIRKTHTQLNYIALQEGVQ